MTADPTQGDVVQELGELARRIADAAPDVIVIACPKCGEAMEPVVIQAISIVRRAFEQRLHVLAAQASGIAACEQMRRAKRP